MTKNRDHQDDDRDKRLQNRDRDKQQNDRDQQSNQKASDQTKGQKITGNPERLQDSAHQMNKRDNAVQGEVDYDQNRHQPNEEPDKKTETRWTDIESDYRKRYPNLTDEDLHYKSGEFSEMTNRIAKRTNRTPEEVTREIRNWDRNH